MFFFFCCGRFIISNYNLALFDGSKNMVMHTSHRVRYSKASLSLITWWSSLYKFGSSLDLSAWNLRTKLEPLVYGKEIETLSLCEVASEMS